MSKYYRPDIEEFCVGFNYEQEEYDGSYTKLTLTEKDSLEYISDHLDEFRVKQLDFEDLEPIWLSTKKGFTTKLRLRMDYEDNNELTFQTYWIEEHEYLDDTYLYYNQKYNNIKITHKSKTLFWGGVKNKFELIKLLKQLGIHE